MLQGLPMWFRVQKVLLMGEGRLGYGPSLGCALVATLLSVGAASLGAQTRGSLQVATQVLPAQPSQLALAQGLSAVRRMPVASQASLAVIAVSRTEGVARRPRLGEQPRTVLTISFLRN
jgi:hypothetical protein